MSELTHSSENQPTPAEMLQAGADFIDYFGIIPSPVDQPAEFLNALKQMDPRYEGNKDLLRFELEQATDSKNWDDEIRGIISETARRMMMVDFDEDGNPISTETPLTGHYDAVVILGGARQANIDRVRYAAQAVAEGNATADLLVVAGASRPLPDAEKQAVANYAPNAETEMDCLAAAANLVEVEHQDRHIEIGEYGIEYVKPDGDKAGTPDVLEGLLEQLETEGIIRPGSRVGVVTTQIYLASTELDARRVGAKHGINTMVAGNPSDLNLIVDRTPATYKSEIIRTLRAAVLALQAEKSDAAAE